MPAVRFTIDADSEQAIIDELSFLSKAPITPDFDQIEKDRFDFDVDKLEAAFGGEVPTELEFVVVSVKAYRGTDPSDARYVEKTDADTIRILAELRPYGDTLKYMPNVGTQYFRVAEVDNGVLTPSALFAVNKLHKAMEDNILTYDLEYEEDGDGELQPWFTGQDMDSILTPLLFGDNDGQEVNQVD